MRTNLELICLDMQHRLGPVCMCELISRKIITRIPYLELSRCWWDGSTIIGWPRMSEPICTKTMDQQSPLKDSKFLTCYEALDMHESSWSCLRPLQGTAGGNVTILKEITHRWGACAGRQKGGGKTHNEICTTHVDRAEKEAASIQAHATS